MSVHPRRETKEMGMRTSRLVGVLVGFLGSAAAALGQSYPIEVSIAVPKIEVRSGPTDKFYATGDLKQGDAVVVLREASEPGWVEIKPPKGSFSWINAKHVKQVSPYEAVVLYDAPGLVGSAVLESKPNVEIKSGFLAGSVLYIVHQPKAVDGETWLPVQPHAREVRYLPKSALNPPVVASPASPQNWAIGAKSSSPTTTIPGYPNNGPTELKPVGNNTTSLSPSPQLPPATNYPSQWSPYGVLRTTTFTREGRPVYALLDRDQKNQLYITTPPGKSLRDFVGKTLCVYGPLVYRPDEYIRTPYM